MSAWLAAIRRGRDFIAGQMNSNEICLGGVLRARMGLICYAREEFVLLIDSDCYNVYG